MRRQIARAAEHFFVVSGIGAFATLLFTLKFAWSMSSMYTGAAVTGALSLLAVASACIFKLANRGSDH
jgi:hypothetical protein